MLYEIFYYTPNGNQEAEFDSAMPWDGVKQTLHHMKKHGNKSIALVVCVDNSSEPQSWYQNGSEIPVPSWSKE